MLSHQAARDQLGKIRKSLPPRGQLELRVEGDELWLNLIRLPATARRGQGSRLLARVLEIADRAGLTTLMEADSTDEPGDPATFDLVRWYQTFGFQRRGLTDDGVLMTRPPAAAQPWEKLLAQAKAAPRLSKDEFDAWAAQQSSVVEQPLIPFAPVLTPMPGSASAQFYDDGLVSGTVELGVNENNLRWIHIDEWNSHQPGLGHASRALKWLRERFDVIAANGIGTIDEGVGDISVCYWQRQHEKGLVDELILDDGTRLEMGPPGRLTLVRGHQGSGKTTYAKSLVAGNPALRHLEQDQFLERDGAYTYDPVRYAAAQAWCLEATRHALACGHDVVVASTFTKLADLQPYTGLPSSGVRVIEMFHDFPNTHGVPDAVVQAKKAQFEPCEHAEQIHPSAPQTSIHARRTPRR